MTTDQLADLPCTHSNVAERSARIAERIGLRPIMLIERDALKRSKRCNNSRVSDTNRPQTLSKLAIATTSLAWNQYPVE